MSHKSAKETMFCQDSSIVVIGIYVVDVIQYRIKAKRHIFDRLSQIIFHYGLWDSGKDYTFNSETVFQMYCTKNGIMHIGIQEREWKVYYPILDPSCLFGIA